MKFLALFVLVAYGSARPHHNSGRCANLGNDDCAIWVPQPNDDFLTPGKRCANLGNDDCAIWFPQAGGDDDFLTPGKRELGNNDFLNSPKMQEQPEANDNSMPGKRCANLGNDDCAIWLPQPSDDFINPGKRCANLGNDDCAIWLPQAGSNDDFLTPGKRSSHHEPLTAHNLRKSLQEFYKKMYHL